MKHGADGIMVSNHGGRSIESGRGTIESLPEVVAGAKGKIPVLFDGGVSTRHRRVQGARPRRQRRGHRSTLCRGDSPPSARKARSVLDILNLELRLAMVGCGARAIREIAASTIIDTHRA